MLLYNLATLLLRRMMMKMERKPYEAPALQVIGEMKDITEAGTAVNGDTVGSRNNAFGPDDIGS